MLLGFQSIFTQKHVRLTSMRKLAAVAPFGEGLIGSVENGCWCSAKVEGIVTEIDILSEITVSVV